MNALELARRRYRNDGLVGVVSRVPRYVGERIKLYKRRLLLGLQRDEVISSRGVYLDWSLSPARGRSGIILDNYEAEEADAVDEFLSPKRDVIELGAGIGFLSCYIANRLEDGVKQVVVEANPELQEVIQRHKSLNDAGFSIEMAAYSPDGNSVRFDVGDDFLTATVSGNGQKGVEVPATTLQEIAQRNHIQDFTLISDIEGLEGALIEEESSLLARHCRVAIIEFHKDILTDVEGKKEILKDAGFELEKSYGMNGCVCVFTKED